LLPTKRGRRSDYVTRLLPLPFLALAGCVTGSIERPMTVREIVQNARVLDGREVVVSGWLEQCQPLACGLYASAAEVRTDVPYYLSIGSSRWFDAFARRAAPTNVVLRARVHDRCISDPSTQVIAVCADRAGSLEPLALVR